MTLVEAISLGTKLYKRFAATEGKDRETLRWHWNEIQRTGVIPLGPRNVDSSRDFTVVVISRGTFKDDDAQFRHIQSLTPPDCNAIRMIRI